LAVRAAEALSIRAAFGWAPIYLPVIATGSVLPRPERGSTALSFVAETSSAIHAAVPTTRSNDLRAPLDVIGSSRNGRSRSAVRWRTITGRAADNMPVNHETGRACRIFPRRDSGIDAVLSYCYTEPPHRARCAGGRAPEGRQEGRTQGLRSAVPRTPIALRERALRQSGGRTSQSSTDGHQRRLFARLVRGGLNVSSITVSIWFFGIDVSTCPARPIRPASGRAVREGRGRSFCS
jgi:hypothetical protein